MIDGKVDDVAVSSNSSFHQRAAICRNNFCAPDNLQYCAQINLLDHFYRCGPNLIQLVDSMGHYYAVVNLVHNTQGAIFNQR